MDGNLDGYSSNGSTSFFRSESPYDSQFGFETGSWSQDEGSRADEMDWDTLYEKYSQFGLETGSRSQDETEMPTLFDGTFKETNESLSKKKKKGRELTPEQREKKRIIDQKFREKGKRIKKEQVVKIQQLEAENVQLKGENMILKVEIGLLRSNGNQLQNQSVSPHLAYDRHGTNSEAVEELSNLEMNELQNLQERFPVNSASSSLGGGIFLPNTKLYPFDVKAWLNDTEAHRNACLQVQEILHKNRRENETVLTSTEEAKQGTFGSNNESDKGEFRSGGAQDEPTDLDGRSGEHSTKILGVMKRKRSLEDAEVDQAKGGQPTNEAAKNSAENQEKRDQTLTTLTDKSTRKHGRGRSQVSAPPNERYIHIGARRGQATLSFAQRLRREKINERMKILQNHVPGCSKFTEDAVAMLDETINYVQSLQRQVEFLAMKLSTFYPISNDDTAAAIMEPLWT